MTTSPIRSSLPPILCSVPKDIGPALPVCAVTWSIAHDRYRPLGAWADAYGIPVNAAVLIAILFGGPQRPPLAPPSAWSVTPDGSRQQQRTVFLRLPAGIHRALRRQAYRTDTSLTEVITERVEASLARLPLPPSPDPHLPPPDDARSHRHGIEWRIAPATARRVRRLTGVIHLPIKALVVVGYLITVVPGIRDGRPVRCSMPADDPSAPVVDDGTTTRPIVIRQLAPSLATAVHHHAQAYHPSRHAAITDLVDRAIPMLDTWWSQWTADEATDDAVGR